MDYPPSRDEILALGIVSGLIGVGALVLALTGSKSATQTCSVLPTESLSGPEVDLASLMTVSLSNPQPLTIINPQVAYTGPGRNIYTYAQVVQTQNGQQVTVMASGVAGVYIGAQNGSVVTTPTVYPLVPSGEAQPAGCTDGQNLCLEVYPATGINPPLCGGPPVLGNGTLQIFLYQCHQGYVSQVNGQNVTCGVGSNNTVDTDGFSSPSCNQRCAVGLAIYENAVVFTA